MGKCDGIVCQRRDGIVCADGECDQASGVYDAPIDNRPAPVASGLFKAMGHQSAPREREKDDFNATPPEPTRSFINAERDRLQDYPVIWESCAGDGAISRELVRAGHEVVNSDIIDRGADSVILRSFYDFKEAPAPAVVTNPPYQEINWRDGHARWLRYGWEELKLEYFAALLSWSWPAAAGHASHWAQYPPARVYLCCWKIDFTGDGSPPQNNGWFVWDRKKPSQHPSGKPEFGLLYRQEDGASPQGSLL